MDEALKQQRKAATEQDKAQARLRAQQQREQHGVVQYAEANAAAWVKAHPVVVAEVRRYLDQGQVEEARAVLGQHLNDPAVIETVISLF